MHGAKPPALSPVAPRLPGAAAAPKVALLVNRNARSVDAHCLARLRAVLGDAHVYASHTLTEAEAMARTVVHRGYEVVACGGGDGTFAGAVNRVARHLRQHNAWCRLVHERRIRQAGGGPPFVPRAMPRFAFLPLGTGNALRHWVHADAAEVHLQQLAQGQKFGCHVLPLIEDEAGETFFFGGMGFDSLLLHDYNRLLRRRHPPFLRPVVRSLAGYVVALGRYTLPTALRDGAPLQLRVQNHGPASYFDPRHSDRPIPLAEGAVLYDGEATMLGVGTEPYFGYGLRAFPFAGAVPRRMHLRIARLSAPQVLRNLAPIWRGTYRHPEALHDFAVREISVQLQTPFPFERCGDDAGLVQALRLRIGQTSVALIDFAHRL